MSVEPTHRTNLVDHFAAFSTTQREELAVRYESSSADPARLAQAVLDRPEAVRTLVERDVIGDEDARRLMEELAYEHDLFIDLSWAGRPARRKLADAGLLAPPTDEAPPHHNRMPAALAAIVAPFMRGVPSTIVTLLGGADPTHVERVAEAWGVSSSTPTETVLELSQHFAAPERVEDLLDVLGAPEYVGAALMVLELGGVCYWQEVFGHDLDQNPEFGSNVVALMRSDEREFEREIADALIDHGVIFRIDESERAPLVVVPEEFWSALWTLGRSWILEWISVGFGTSEQAVRRSDEEPPAPLQPILKLFALLADRSELRGTADGGLDDPSIERLAEVGGADVSFWQGRAQLAMELSALRLRSDGAFEPNESFKRVLDLPQTSFVRQVLFDWCTGYVSAGADAHLADAFALDEVWREEAVELLSERAEFVPLWMRSEGVDPMTTGCGFIRTAGDSESALLLVEIGLVNGLVWSAKLVWLDLLSLLQSDMWYPIAFLTELLQLSGGLATFTQLIHVLEQPNLGYYLPVQRASFVADQLHTGHFEAWVSGVVTDLFEPLGVGQLSDDGEFVWLDNAGFRVESPPGLPDDTRELLMREIFEDAELEFTIPSQTPARLHTIGEVSDVEFISLDRPLDEVRDWLGDRSIARFDGRRLWVG